jgi:GcrA cell cycle regulator
MSCSQIAAEIDVSRNAVIGKLHRLGLTRSPAIATGPIGRPAAELAQARSQRSWRSQRSRISIVTRHEMREAAPHGSRTRSENVPILNGRGCTLLELGHEQCRWPIGSPGATGFCFCGNEPVKGLSYCPGHARLAYRPPARRRGRAGAY